MDHPLINLMHACVVKLTIPEIGSYGTGFFVAPGIILTCAHVVGDTETGEVFRGEIKIRWKDQKEFAIAQIMPDRWLPKIDVTLLSFSTDGVDKLPCVFLGKELKAGDDLVTFGYSKDFPNGGPATVEFEGYTGDEPPVAKFKLGNIRPGMSGAPILNHRTGCVCGIVNFTLGRGSIIGGGGVTTTTILTHCDELDERQKWFHDRDTRWRGRMGPGYRFETIHKLEDTVCKEIAAKLEDGRQASLRERLTAIFIEKKKIAARTSTEIAAKLVEFKPFETLPLVYAARENAVKTMGAKGDGDDAIQWILKGTEDILGWLVLLTVNTAWINENRLSLYPEAFPGALEIPVKTETGIEIVHATLNQRHAQFDITEGTLFGARRIPPAGHQSLEAGFDTNDAVSEIKKSIYAYISKGGWGEKVAPNNVTLDLDEEINAQLEWWNDLNDTRYLVVERTESGHPNPINDQAVYAALLNDLPALRVIFHNTGRDDTAFKVSEISLATKLRNFFLPREES